MVLNAIAMLGGCERTSKDAMKGFPFCVRGRVFLHWREKVRQKVGRARRWNPREVSYTGPWMIRHLSTTRGATLDPFVARRQDIVRCFATDDR